MSFRLASLVLASALLSSCGGGVVIGANAFDCDAEMASLTGTLGFPDEVDRRFDGGLHIHTFLYVRSGVSVVFTWGSDFACHRRDILVSGR
jgi:hypothetical protein